MTTNAPSLSLVIPVYNEPEAIRALLRHLPQVLLSSRWKDPEIIVVDDGSTDETSKVLDEMDTGTRLRVIHQTNQGRLRARTTGLRHATGDYVLFLDARVRIERGLDTLVDRVEEGMTIWNAHVDVFTGSGLLATFWDAPTRILWHQYFGNPRRVSYGIEDFHRYPKGTTGFLAPRHILLSAFDAFNSSYADPRHANDDTAVLQHVARNHRIWVSPEFVLQYRPRHSLRRFVPHAHHRGIVFVDGFLHKGNPYAPVIVAFYGLSAALLPLGLRRRWLIPSAYLSATVVAVSAGLIRRLPGRHLVALAVVTPIFITSYGSGLWTGLALRIRARLASC